LNDCIDQNWKVVKRVEDAVLLDLVQEMSDFVHPIFVITAEAARWGYTDMQQIALFNEERVRVAKFVAGHGIIALQGSTFYDSWWHMTKPSDRWHAYYTGHDVGHGSSDGSRTLNPSCFP
jgi:hypothetical protein